MAHSYKNKQRIPATANTTDTANPMTASVTLDSDATLLVVVPLYAGSSDRTGGAPTYNGVSLSQSGSVRRGTTSPECSVELWYMVNPPVGSAYTLNVPNAGALAMSVDVAWFAAASGYTSALDAEGGANKASGTNPTHSVTSLTANDLLIGVLANGANSWAPTAQSGTAIYNNDDGTWGGGSQYILDCGTTGSETSSWTFGTSEDHGVQVALFKQVVRVSDGTLSKSLDDLSKSLLGMVDIVGQASQTMEDISKTLIGAIEVKGHIGV